MVKPAVIIRNLIRDQVYEYLREQLTVGSMQPGSIIENKKLMKELGVSQTPLREAFLQLQMDGFVTIMPQRGVRINTIKLQDIEEIYEILGGLESRVILSVFSKIGQSEIKKMNKINNEMIAASKKEDLNGFYDKNISFHDVFFGLSENKRLLDYAIKLKHQLYDFPRRDYGKEWKEQNCKEHQEFIKLVEEGDAKKTSEYMRDVHWVLRPIEKSKLKEF